MDPASIGALLSGGSSLLGGIEGLFSGDGGASGATTRALDQAENQYTDTKNLNGRVAGQQLALADPQYQQDVAAQRRYLAELGLPYITSDVVGSNIQHQGDNYVGVRADGSTFFVNDLPQGGAGGQQPAQQSGPFGAPQQQGGGAAGWNPDAAMGSPIGTVDGVQYFRRDRNQLMPYQWAGGTGFTETPGYEFRVSEGMKGLDRGAASRGMLLSGAQLKDYSRFNQGTASDEYNRWLDRVGAVAGQAPQAASTTGAVGGNLAAGQAANGNNLANLALSRGATGADVASRSQSAFSGNLANIVKGLGGISTYFGA